MNTPVSWMSKRFVLLAFQTDPWCRWVPMNGWTLEFSGFTCFAIRVTDFSMLKSADIVHMHGREIRTEVPDILLYSTKTITGWKKKTLAGTLRRTTREITICRYTNPHSSGKDGFWHTCEEPPRCHRPHCIQRAPEIKPLKTLVEPGSALGCELSPGPGVEVLSIPGSPAT